MQIEKREDAPKAPCVGCGRPLSAFSMKKVVVGVVDLGRFVAPRYKAMCGVCAEIEYHKLIYGPVPHG